MAALHDIGTIPRRDLGWASLALARSVGAPPGLAIPWASWALRLCERARVPDAGGDVAVAVSAVAAGRVAGAPDDLARGALAACVLGRHTDAAQAHGWLLSLAVHAASSAPHNPPFAGGVSPASASRADAREVVALWTAPALIAGDAPAPWLRFGEAVAEPVGLLDALVRLWLDPVAPDLEGPALTPLLALWLRDAELGPPLLRALAGERSSPVRRIGIHDLLASRRYRAALSARAAGLLVAAREVLAGVAPPGPRPRGLPVSAAADFLDVLAERFRFFDGLLAFRDLLGARPAASPDAAPAVRAPSGDAGADLRAALDHLVETAPWRESWEVQRFGLLGSTAPPVGQWFIRATILGALEEAGRDVTREATALLDEIPAGELRYYGAFREIPPDADDLAAVLELAAATGAGAGRVESWLELMRLNLGDDGVVPTWFYRGVDGPTTAGPRWSGDDCNAVRLNLLAALLSFDAARFDPLIQANAARVLAASGGGVVGGVYHYDASYAALAFLRFARRYREKAARRPHAPGLAAVEAVIRARDAALQRLDGGWSSPQATAACLEGAALSSSSPDPLLVDRALRYLSEHQLADGSWPAEPLYRNPAKGGRVWRHGGGALTTALCARAIASVCPRSQRGQ